MSHAGRVTAGKAGLHATRMLSDCSWVGAVKVSLRTLVIAIGLFVAAITAVSLAAAYFAVRHVNAVALLALLSCLLALGLFLAVRSLPLRALDQTLGVLANTNSQFDLALNNMSQGLLLFDSNKRIAVVNRKYIEMYGLSSDVVKPGLKFSDLLRHRKETGSFHGDVDQYCADIYAASLKGQPRALSSTCPADARSCW